MFDDILEALGIKDVDELSEDERVEYTKMLDLQQRQSLTLEDFRSHIRLMKQQVEMEVCSPGLDKEKQIHLLARLKNYVLLEAFFEGPERAKKALDQYVRNFKTSSGR